MIVLYRIDDRLIHGQTMIKLIPKIPCDGIIIVNDELTKRRDMMEIYAGVIPSSIKLHVFSCEAALRKLPEAAASAKRYYVIVKSVCDFAKLFDGGFRIEDEITVGCCSRKEGSVAVNDGFFLMPEEIKAYNHLDDAGYRFSIMTMISKTAESWKTFRSKFEGGE